MHITQNTVAKSLFLTDECLTEGMGCFELSRFFVNHYSFYLLYFVPQFLWKHELFVFKDSYRMVCTRFPFLSRISVIASHSRSSSPRFLNSVHTSHLSRFCQETPGFDGNLQVSRFPSQNNILKLFQNNHPNQVYLLYLLHR